MKLPLTLFIDYIELLFLRFIARIGIDKDLPGLSCKDISDSHKDLASGVYWIDPTDSSNPFTVFCDMTTDGGEMNHINR